MYGRLRLPWGPAIDLKGRTVFTVGSFSCNHQFIITSTARDYSMPGSPTAVFFPPMMLVVTPNESAEQRYSFSSHSSQALLAPDILLSPCNNFRQYEGEKGNRIVDYFESWETPAAEVLWNLLKPAQRGSE